MGFVMPKSTMAKLKNGQTLSDAENRLLISKLSPLKLMQLILQQSPPKQ